MDGTFSKLGVGTILSNLKGNMSFLLYSIETTENIVSESYILSATRYSALLKMSFTLTALYPLKKCALFLILNNSGHSHSEFLITTNF